MCLQKNGVPADGRNKRDGRKGSVVGVKCETVFVAVKVN